MTSPGQDRPARRRRISTDRDARMVDAIVVPRFSAHFARYILDSLPRGARQVLDVGCGTGHVSFEVLSRLGPGSRVIAIDPDAGLVDLARRRGWEQTGKRLFFKNESAEKLSFGDGVFDVITSNLVYDELVDPLAALREMRRVVAPSGTLLLSTPLRGTFDEILEMLLEVARAEADQGLEQRTRSARAALPEPAELDASLRRAGWERIELHEHPLRLSFRNAAELFQDPLVRLVALPRWIEIAGDEAVLTDVERRLQTYFAGGPLSLSVRVGGVAAHA